MPRIKEGFKGERAIVLPAFLIEELNPNRSLEKVSCHFLMTAIRKTALYMLDL